jgi:hypothetical protein
MLDGPNSQTSPHFGNELGGLPVIPAFTTRHAHNLIDKIFHLHFSPLSVFSKI